MRVRTALNNAGMKQYELAWLLGMYEEKLSRMLRRELSDEEQGKLIELIEQQTKEVKR